MTQFLASIKLILFATAVVGLNGNNLPTEYGMKIKKNKTSNWNTFGSQTVEFDELYPSGRYSEFRPLLMKLPQKNNQLKSNYKTSKPHFPVPAHSYLPPDYILPSEFKPFTAPNVPKKKIPSDDRPSSVYPTAYYTEPPIFSYTTPSYPLPTFSPSPYFPPENIDSSYDQPQILPQYPSIFYKDSNKVPESSYNHVSAETVNDDDDFPKFDDFIKQSLSFENFRP